MLRVRIVCLLMTAACLLSMGRAVAAAEVDCDATYCFTPEDFSQGDPLMGVCITGLPESEAGTILLGTRVIRAGDILTAQQLAQMTFSPLRTETDRDAVVTYLPIYENRVAPTAAMTIAIRGKTDQAPAAQDSTIETYKNLPNEGLLKVSDPEGQALTYTLVRKPKRGEVTIREDGSFIYTPKKNKVGVDSFTYTAADPAGNVSREATVTVQILKPTDARQYTDTVGRDCRFAAEWMRNTGLFVGEKLGQQECFFPDKAVSRGQFLTMLVQALDIPTEDVSYDAVPQDTPDWLKPYYAAALRSGLTAGLPANETGSFDAEQPITGAEAAVMLQNALDLTIPQQVLETMQQDDTQGQVPDWAAISLTAMAENGIALNANEDLTRGQVAQLMYRTARLAPNAPGSAVLRMQQ